MSRYTPTLDELRAKQDERGWWVHDRFGRIDGPYESQTDAQATFHAEAALGHEIPVPDESRTR